METPRTRAGDLTELIMARATLKINNRSAPELTTVQYNAIYDAVYSVLANHIVEETP